jgi:hypothetical protein
MLFPFLPRSPQRVASCPPSASSPTAREAREDGGRLAAPPPRIADTEDWAQRACLRMADVTVIHSVMIRATGSMATLTARVAVGLSPAVVKLDLLLCTSSAPMPLLIVLVELLPCTLTCYSENHPNVVDVSIKAVKASCTDSPQILASTHPRASPHPL